MASSDVFVTFGGDTAGLEASLASAKAAVTSVTAEMRRLAQEMQKTGAAADSELGQKLQAAAMRLTAAKAAAGELGEQLHGTHEAAGEAGGAIAMLHENLRRLAEIAGISLGVEAFKEWIVSSAELGEQMERVGAEMGVTASQASMLSGIAQLTGTDFGSLQKDIERFQLNLAKSGSESSIIAQGLKALGLSAKEFVGVPIPQQLEKLAEATSHFADGGAKTAAIMTILGRNGVEMLPFLDRGKEGFEELQEVLQRTGAVMSDQVASSFGATKEHLSELELAWQGLSNRIYDVVNPSVDSVVKSLARMVESLNPATIRADIISITEAIFGGLKALGDFAISVSAMFQIAVGDVQNLKYELAGIAAGAVAGGAVGGPLGAIAGGAFMGIAQPAIDNSINGPSKTTDPREQIAAFDQSINKMLEGLKNLISGHGAGTPRGEGRPGGSFPLDTPKPQAGTIDTGGAAAARKNASDALAATMAGYTQGLAAFKDMVSEREKALNDELAHHKISVEEWLAQTVGALNAEKSNVQAAYDKELQLAGLTLRQKADLKKQEAADEEKIDDQITAATTKAANEQAKVYRSAFGGMNSALLAQINPLLEGTETITAAFQKMAASIIEGLIKVAAEALLTKAELALISAIPGAGGLLSSITSFMMPSFDVGTNYVAATGPAVVHAGEMIVPAALASQLRNIGFNATGRGFEPSSFSGLRDGASALMGGNSSAQTSPVPVLGDLMRSASGNQDGGATGGDIHVHLHVEGAVTPQDFMRIVNQNLDNMASAFSRRLNSAPGLRPKY